MGTDAATGFTIGGRVQEDLEKTPLSEGWVAAGRRGRLGQVELLVAWDAGPARGHVDWVWVSDLRPVHGPTPIETQRAGETYRRAGRRLPEPCATILGRVGGPWEERSDVPTDANRWVEASLDAPAEWREVAYLRHDVAIPIGFDEPAWGGISAERGSEVVAALRGVVARELGRDDAPRWIVARVFVAGGMS